MAVTQAVTTPQVPPLGAPGNVTPPGSTGTTTSSGSTPAQDALSIGKTFDQFLTLLTTQLKNQDPLSPEDSTQFTSQLVQFSQVEQEINTNTKLDTLIAANQSNQLLQAASFLGKSVEVAGNGVHFDGTNPVQFGYTVNGDFSSASITVTDSNGNVVRNAPVSLQTGHNVLSWDGSDANGHTLPAGAYTITLNALDSAGKPVDVTQSTIGNVTDVELQNNQTMITIDGGKPMPLSNIISVRS
jgi:flagellar basal-body rod modification protein FlgD